MLSSLPTTCLSRPCEALGPWLCIVITEIQGCSRQVIWICRFKPDPGTGNTEGAATLALEDTSGTLYISSTIPLTEPVGCQLVAQGTYVSVADFTRLTVFLMQFCGYNPRPAHLPQQRSARGCQAESPVCPEGYRS